MIQRRLLQYVVRENVLAKCVFVSLDDVNGFIFEISFIMFHCSFDDYILGRDKWAISALDILSRFY